VLASEELAQRMWHINDLYGATPAHPAELLSVIAFDNLANVATRANALLATNRQALDAFLKTRDDLAFFRPTNGNVIFPKLLSGKMDEFYRLLRDKYETSVVPGIFFDMPQHFRIGIGGDSEMTAEGLLRLAQCLDELRRV
jgi:hypothetical protein